MSAKARKTIRKVLGSVGLYQRVKFSCWYDLYWSAVDRSLIDKRSNEVQFFQTTLEGFKAGNLIFDIGANHGYKTDIFLRLGARVIAVEVDPLNQEILKQSFLTCRIRKKPVRIIGKGVSEKNGVSTMWIDEPGSGKNTLNAKWVDTLRADAKRFGRTLQFSQKLQVETTTLEDLMQVHGRPFYVKIDVEGHETSVLRGMETAVPYLSFEANLPEFAPEALRCIDLLEELAPGAQFNYTANCGQGMALEKWVGYRDCQLLVAHCTEPSIEVFCKSPQPLNQYFL